MRDQSLMVYMELGLKNILQANTNQLLISINERNIKMLKPIKNNELCHHVFSFNGIGIQLIERDNRFIIYVNTIELVSYMDKIDAENFGIKLITAIKNNDLQ